MVTVPDLSVFFYILTESKNYQEIKNRHNFLNFYGKLEVDKTWRHIYLKKIKINMAKYSDSLYWCLPLCVAGTRLPHLARNLRRGVFGGLAPGRLWYEEKFATSSRFTLRELALTVRKIGGRQVGPSHESRPRFTHLWMVVCYSIGEQRSLGSTTSHYLTKFTSKNCLQD